MSERKVIYILLMQENKSKGGDLLSRQIKIAGLTASREAALKAEKDDDNVGISFPRSADINRDLEFENKMLKNEAKAKREIENALDWYIREFMK